MEFTDYFSSDVEPVPSLEKWTETFYEMPTDLFTKLMNNNMEDWEEVTEVQIGSTVILMTMDHFDQLATVESISISEDGPLYEVMLLDSKETLTLQGDAFELHQDSVYPTGLKVYTFNTAADNLWLAKNGVNELSKLGLRVFKSNRFGFFFSSDNVVGDANLYLYVWGKMYDVRFHLGEK